MSGCANAQLRPEGQACVPIGRGAPHPLAELVLPKGYPLENHTVQTSDGYILTLYRIPHGKLGPNRCTEMGGVCLLRDGVGG